MGSKYDSVSHWMIDIDNQNIDSILRAEQIKDECNWHLKYLAE